MGSGFMIVYNHVELDFGSVFVLDAHGAGPWTVFLFPSEGHFPFLLCSPFSPKPTSLSTELRY